MKKLLPIIALVMIIAGCNNKPQDNFNMYEWNYGFALSDENDEQSYNEIVFVRNDSCMTFQDTYAFPIEKLDKQIVCSWSFPDTVITDTSDFDFKKILGTKTLLINSELYDMIVLTCNTPSESFAETNNFFEEINYKVGGYTIGDSINTDLLENIEEKTGIDSYGLITGNQKVNEDITVDVLLEKYVYRLLQKNIKAGSELNEVVNAINNNMGFLPDTTYDAVNYITKIRWEKDGAYLTLTNQDDNKYWTNRSNNEPGKSLKEYYLIVAEEYLPYKDDYTLEYNDAVLQSVLRSKDK